MALPGEWRTNAALGAKVEPVVAPPLAMTLALAGAIFADTVAALLGAPSPAAGPGSRPFS